MDAWKIIFLFNWVILMFHAHFQGVSEKKPPKTHSLNIQRPFEKIFELQKGYVDV